MTPHRHVFRAQCSKYRREIMKRVIHNPGQSVPIPRHSQTRAKNADLVTLET